MNKLFKGFEIINKMKRMGNIFIILSIIGGILVLIGGIGWKMNSSKMQQVSEKKAIKQRELIQDGVESTKDEMKKNTNVTNKYIESEIFFREKDFNILKRYFPNGCMITRQNINGLTFSKSTHNDAIIFENSENKIIFDDFKRPSLLMNVKALMPKEYVDINIGAAFPINLSDEARFIMQNANSIRIGNSCNYFLLIEKDELGYTFAVGRAPCK